MGVLDDIERLYGGDEEPQSGSVLDEIERLYGGDDEALSVEEQRARLYANAMPAGELALDDSGYVGATASGIPGFINRLSQFEEFTQEANPLVSGVMAPLIAGQRGAAEIMKAIAPEKYEAYVAARDAEQQYRAGIAQAAMPEDPNIVQEALASLPQMGLSALTGPAMPAVNIAASIGAAADEAESRDLEGPVATVKPLVEGLGIGALESLGVESIVGKGLFKVAKPAAGRLGRALQRGLVGGTGETVTEGLQEGLSIASEIATGRESEGLGAELERVLRAAAGGGILGGSIGAGGGALSRGERPAAPPQVAPQVAPEVEAGPVNSTESALAEVSQLALDAKMAERERELSELPIGLEMAEVEQQIDVLRQMEDQARLRAAEIARRVDEAANAAALAPLDDTVAVGDMGDATVAEIPSYVTDETQPIKGFGDQTIQDIRRGVLDTDETVSISDLNDATVAGRYPSSRVIGSDMDETSIAPDLADVTLGMMPAPVASAEAVLDGAASMADEIVEAQRDREAVAIAQAPGSTFDAVMGGDPASMGSPEYFAAQRAQFEDKLLTLRQKYEEAKAAVKDAGDGAAKEVMTDAEAREALSVIRRGALEQALRHGDADLFDRLDVETKRRLNLFPQDLDETAVIEQRGEATLPETMAELRDVTFAAMPHVEERANATYDVLNKAGGLPVDETGQSVPREIFVREQVLSFQTALTDQFRDLAYKLKPDGSNANEIQRKARSVVNKTLKRFNLTRADVGFRGDSAIERQGIIDAGAEWLRGQLGGKTLTDLSDADLTAIARTARQMDAPSSSFTFLINELSRRQRNEPPVRYSPGSMSPDRAIALAQRGVEENLNPKLAKILDVDPPTYAKGQGHTALERSAYWWRKFVGRVGGMFRSNTALGPAKPGLKWVPTTHYYQADLADSVFNHRDRRERNNAIKLMGEARDAASATAATMHYKINSWAVGVQKSLKAYVAGERAAGRAIKLADAATQIYEAINERKVETLPQGLQQIVKDSEDIRAEFREYARQLANGDKAKLAEIERLGDAYLFRSYAIHKDPDAIFRQVDKGSEPYKAFYNRIVREGYAPLYEMAYEDAAPGLREIGYTEPMIQETVEAAVMAKHIPDLIERIAKQTLENPDTQSPVTSRIGKAKKEILIERVNEDPNLRKILGEERDFTLAMVEGMEKVANDMAKLQLTTRLMDIWTGLGLVGDKPSGIRTVALSKAKLDKIRDDDGDVEVLYVTPEVNSVLSGVRNATDGFDQVASQVIALTKMGFVANPGTALQNWWGLPQTVLAAGGLIGSSRALANKGKYIRFAHLVARELSFPGNGISKLTGPEASKLFADLGLTPESLQEAVLRLQELGLDSGGELAVEFSRSVGALMSGAKAATGSKLSSVQRLANATMEVYRHPDLMSKVVAYNMFLDELKHKAGVATPSEEMQREAAKRALNVTQNPKSTPEIIRAMNKGRLGLLTFSFAGFQYQMMRNLYFSYKFAFDDATASVRYGREASRLEAAGNKLGAAKAREKAGVYGMYALDRAAGATTASVLTGVAYQRFFAFLAEALGGDDERESERHLKALMPFPEQRANRLAPISTWRKNGKTYATVAHVGKVDIFDGAMSVLRKLAENPQGEKAVPTDGAEAGRRVMAAMALVREQFTGLSAFADAMGIFMRVAQSKNPTMGDFADAAMDSVAKLGPKVGATPIETVGRAKKAMAAGAMEISSEFPFVSGDPANKDFEKFRRNVIRWGSGLGVQTMPVDDYYSSRAHDIWGEANWRRDARTEWAAAATPSAKLKVKAKYADKWDSLQNALWNISEHGIGAGLNPNAMRTALGDEEVTKYKGEKIPKWMHQKVAYRQNVSLDSYLKESTKGLR